MKQKDITPFFQAILDGNIEEVEKQISSGVDIKEIDSKGRNAIFYAVIGGKLKLLKLLIQKGLSPKFIDPVTGGSMLHVASSEQHMHILRYLVVDCHIDVNILDKNNHTVLYDCMVFTQMETAVFLIENGAKNINNIQHIEGLLRYVKKYLETADIYMKYDIDTCKKNRLNLRNFIVENSQIPEKCSKKANSNVGKILLELGIKRGKELSFYKNNLNLEQEEELISLYTENPKDKKIRTIIWWCYLENWVTRFFATRPDKFMYPAYLLPFTGEELKRDWGIKDDEAEGIEVADFIKTVDTFLPRFGRDYYLVEKGWVSIPYDEEGASFDDVQVEISKDYTKDTGILEKYELMRKAWTYASCEESWLWYSRLSLSGQIKMAF